MSVCGATGHVAEVHQLFPAKKLRSKTKGYWAMPESIQRWKTLIFSALQAPSHGIDPP
jgi:hypothetical protein